jgi:hypothetical protein
MSEFMCSLKVLNIENKTVLIHKNRCNLHLELFFFYRTAYNVNLVNKVRGEETWNEMWAFQGPFRIIDYGQHHFW